MAADGLLVALLLPALIVPKRCDADSALYFAGKPSLLIT